MLNEQISTQFKNLSVELNKTVDDKEILQYNNQTIQDTQRKFV